MLITGNRGEFKTTRENEGTRACPSNVAGTVVG